jgi:hypothetical protein
MRGYLRGLVFLFFITCATPAMAQVKVIVDATTEDDVGKQLAFAFKEQIRQSATFAETYDETKAVLGANLVTLDVDEGSTRSQTQTVYSLTLVIKRNDGFDNFITSYVGKCGASVVSSCASRMLLNMGVQLEELRAAILSVNRQSPTY